MNKGKQIIHGVFRPTATIQSRPRSPMIHTFHCATCGTERQFARELQTSTLEARAYLYCINCNHARLHWHADKVKGENNDPCIRH